MTNHDLLSQDWMLVRLAILALDIAAVVFIVWLVGLTRRWRRDMARAIGDHMRRRARSGNRACGIHHARNTASHPGVR